MRYAAYVGLCLVAIAFAIGAGLQPTRAACAVLAALCVVAAIEIVKD
jgi:hypothetical protein